MVSIIKLLGGALEEAVVESYDKGKKAYACFLAIRNTDNIARIRSRISDVVALSLISGIRLRINTALLGRDLAV